MSKAPRNSANRDRMRARIKATRANCHICGQPIDYDLPWLDPMSFQVDHVVPLARGGSDTIDNAKASHRQCNSSKRARLVAPVVKRSQSLK